MFVYKRTTRLNDEMVVRYEHNVYPLASVDVKYDISMENITEVSILLDNWCTSKVVDSLYGLFFDNNGASVAVERYRCWQDVYHLLQKLKLKPM